MARCRLHLSESLAFAPMVPALFLLGVGILHSMLKATQLVHGTPRLAASHRTWIASWWLVHGDGECVCAGRREGVVGEEQEEKEGRRGGGKRGRAGRAGRTGRAGRVGKVGRIGRIERAGRAGRGGRARATRAEIARARAEAVGAVLGNLLCAHGRSTIGTVSSVLFTKGIARITRCWPAYLASTGGPLSGQKQDCQHNVCIPWL